jgi:hypothetical protein
VLMAVFLMVGYLWLTEPKSKTNIQEVPIHITATQLHKDYSKAYVDNKLAAEQNYKGKLFEVEGKVDSVGNDVFGKLQLDISADEFFADDIQIHMDDTYKDWLSKLHKGQSVLVKARFKEMTVTWIEMDAE